MRDLTIFVKIFLKRHLTLFGNFPKIYCNFMTKRLEIFMNTNCIYICQLEVQQQIVASASSMCFLNEIYCLSCHAHLSTFFCQFDTLLNRRWWPCRLLLPGGSVPKGDLKGTKGTVEDKSQGTWNICHLL